MSHSHRDLGVDAAVQPEMPRPRAEMNLTPLIDILLVLLVIFLAALPLTQKAIDSQLPAQTHAGESLEQTVVAIGRNKQMYINAKPVQESEMAIKVDELLENAKEKIVLIKADEEVEYGTVMAAMDQLRQAGIEDIGLITERKKGAEGAGGK